MIEHVWPTFWTGAMLHFTSVCVSMEGYSVTATGSISTFRKHLSSSVGPWCCTVASSHVSLLQGGCCSSKLQSFTSSTATDTIADTILSIFLTVSTLAMRFLLFLSKHGVWCCPSPPPVCCCLTGAEMAQLCSCCPSSAQPGPRLFLSLPHCTISTAVPSRPTHNLTA